MENSLALPTRSIRRTRIKFCGLTRIEDVQCAVALGVDAIGFVFHPMSARAVSLPQAVELAKEIPPFISIVGVFVDAAPSVVQQIAQTVPLSILQLHGDETPAECMALGRATGLPWIRALRITREAQTSHHSAPPTQTSTPNNPLVPTSVFAAAGAVTTPLGAQRADAEIADVHSSESSIKTGKGPDAVRASVHAYEGARAFLLDTFTSNHGGSGKVFDWSRIPEELAAQIILSGGLSIDNIHKAITCIHPYAVDVSSGIEAVAPGCKDHSRMAAFVQAVREADAAVASKA